MAAPSSCRLETFPLHCHSLWFSARNGILGDLSKGMRKDGWEKAARVIHCLSSDKSFRSFHPTGSRNHSLWIERRPRTSSAQSCAPRACMLSLAACFWFFTFLPLLPTSTFAKPSCLSGQTRGSYLYAAQISESVLSLCRVKNGLHFLDSPCGCKE